MPDRPEIGIPLSAEARAVYDELPPLQKRRAAQMMIGAAHLLNEINIEQMEQEALKTDLRFAQELTHLITRTQS